MGRDSGYHLEVLALTDPLAEKLRWFMDHLDLPPLQLHIPDSVWFDHDDGAGSMLGSPALSRDWRLWLEAVYGRETEAEMVPCFHTGRPEGTICGLCAIYSGDGQPIAESGQRRSRRVTYRWPMRAAIADLGLAVTPLGWPSFSVTLLTLARAGGDPVSAADILTRRWPRMGDPRSARCQFLRALNRVQDVWAGYDPTAGRGNST